MAQCIECGSAVVPGETFCSNCGTKHPEAAKDSKESTGPAHEGTSAAAAAAGSAMDESPDDASESGAASENLVDDSLGGASTGDVNVPAKHTVKKGTTGGH